MMKPTIVFYADPPKLCQICARETKMEPVEIIDKDELLKQVYTQGFGALECTECKSRFVFEKKE